MTRFVEMPAVRWRGILTGVVLGAAVCSSAGANTAAPATVLQLEAGQTHVLDVPELGRVAVGDGAIVQAVAADGREVLVFARRPGQTTLHVWTRTGRRRAWLVQVLASGAQRMADEVTALLARIPNARSTAVGERILIEGEDLSDADLARIAELVQRYPDVLDFTGQVGWDRMVMLDVQVIEVPRSALQEYGVRWDAATQGGLTAGAAWDVAASGRWQSRPGEALPLPAPWPNRALQGYFGLHALLASRIQALAQQGDAVTLAQPQLLARSGATASFLAGGELPYITTDAKGQSTTIFKPYGVSLAITPQIERNDTVRARIEIEVSAVDSSLSANGGPAMKTRRAATEFNVRSGQTLVLGGFISREQWRDQDALPGLGRLPVIGALFRSRRFQQRETELVILVTPVVTVQDDAGLQQRVDVARDLVTQAFPAPLRIHPPLTSATSAWDPFSGPGSQWTGAAHSSQEGNVYAFDD